MGDRLFLGRDFVPEEGEVGKDHVVILTHRLWLHLGADRGIIGKQIKMGGEPYTVVGVNRPGQIDRLESQFIVPLSFRPDQINHDFHWLLVLGRLKPGVSLSQAQADMNVVTARIAQDIRSPIKVGPPVSKSCTTISSPRIPRRFYGC